MVSFGRAAAGYGLLLRGDPSRCRAAPAGAACAPFTPVRAAESGFFVPGQTRDVRRVRAAGSRAASIAIHCAFGTQILLGIATVMSGVALWLAVLHQAVGALLVAASVVLVLAWLAASR